MQNKHISMEIISKEKSLIILNFKGFNKLYLEVASLDYCLLLSDTK